MDGNGEVLKFIKALDDVVETLGGSNTRIASAVNEAVNQAGRGVEKVRKSNSELLQAIGNSDVLSGLATLFSVANKTGDKGASDLMIKALKFSGTSTGTPALKPFYDALDASLSTIERGEKTMAFLFKSISNVAQLRVDNKMTQEAFESFKKVIEDLGKTTKADDKALLNFQKGAAHVVVNLEKMAKKVAGGDNFIITKFEESTRVITAKGDDIGERIYDVRILVDGKTFDIEMKSWDPENFSVYMAQSLKGLKHSDDVAILPGQMAKDLPIVLAQAELRVTESGLKISDDLSKVTKRWAFDERMNLSKKTPGDLADDIIDILLSDGALLKRLFARSVKGGAKELGELSGKKFNEIEEFVETDKFKKVLEEIFIVNYDVK